VGINYLKILLSLSILFLFSCEQNKKQSEYKNRDFLKKYTVLESFLKTYNFVSATKVWNEIDSSIQFETWDSLKHVHTLAKYRYLLNFKMYDSTLKLLPTAYNNLNKDKYKSIYFELKRLETVCQTQTGLYLDGIKNSLLILPFYEQEKNHKRVCGIKANIGWCYFNLNDFNDAIVFINQSINDAKTHQLEILLSDYYQRMATVYSGKLQFIVKDKQKDFDSAMLYFNKSFELIDTTEPSWELTNYYINVTGLHTVMNNHLDAIFCAKKGLLISEKIQDYDGLSMFNVNMGVSYLKLNDFENALKYFKAAEKYAKEHDLVDGLNAINKNLATVYAKQKKFELSTIYYEDYITQYFIEFNQNNSSIAQELSKKYQTEIIEKELEIAKNRELISKNNFHISLFIVGLVALFVVGLLLYFTQKIKIRKNLEIIQLKYQSAIVKKETEIQERIRISRNLHDNLGAYASSISKNIDLIESNQSINMLSLAELKYNSDQILSNLKNVVIDLNQKLLPFTEFIDIIKTELLRLLRSYPAIEFDINEQINYSAFLDVEKQLNLKAILFELVHNSIKHSGCKNFKLDITENSNSIFLKLEDDGVFNEKINNFSGNGIVNISERISFLNADYKHFKNKLGGTSSEIAIKKWS